MNVAYRGRAAEYVLFLTLSQAASAPPPPLSALAPAGGLTRSILAKPSPTSSSAGGAWVSVRERGARWANGKLARLIQLQLIIYGQRFGLVRRSHTSRSSIRGVMHRIAVVAFA
jgi:hypothetical protein